MARIRTIKPEFWRDEHLSSVSAEASLLAIGLLNHCDDEGWFNANPKLVESDVFPLRQLSKDTTVLLRELSDIGYISTQVGSDGKNYGKVMNFERHQVINKKTPSKIKELCKLPEECSSPLVALPTGKERKGSGNGNGKDYLEANASLSGTTFPPCPHQEILNLWKKNLPHLAQPRSWEGSRVGMLKARWIQAAKPSSYSEDGYATVQEGLEWWDSFFTYIAKHSTLAKGYESNGRVWTPDLPWVLNATNFQKIVDGKYDK